MNEKPHDNNFNLLRLIGACCVIFSHSFYVLGKDAFEPVNAVTHGTMEASAIGLVIFFFISGYFVTKSALLSPSIFSFIQKRILRIYPALIVCVVLSVFISGPLLTELPISNYFSNSNTYKYLITASAVSIKMELPGVFQNSNYFMHGFNASLWSVGLEIKLYFSLVIISLLSLLFNRKKAFHCCSLLLLIAGIISLLFFDTLPYDWRRNINLMTVFYFGSFVYSAALNKKNMLIILATSILFCLLSFTLLANKIHGDVFVWIIIGTVTYLAGTFNRIKINLQTDISYGLYIYAFPVQQTVFYITGYNSNVLLNLFLSFVITAVLAFLSWQFIEKPFIQLKRKI